MPDEYEPFRALYHKIDELREDIFRLHHKETLIMGFVTGDNTKARVQVTAGKDDAGETGTLPTDLGITLDDTTDYTSAPSVDSTGAVIANTWDIQRTGTGNAAADGSGTVNYTIASTATPALAVTGQVTFNPDATTSLDVSVTAIPIAPAA